jgi:WD40 repeat protein
MKHEGGLVHGVEGALFDKAETRILSWSLDATVRLWDAATGEPRGAPMKHELWVSGAVFDKAETRILSWSLDAVRLWDAATGEPRGAPMKHEGAVWGPVLGAVFNRAETRILSWSADGTIRLWDVARLGPGNLVEAACRLLPDKDVSTLRGDFGVDVTDTICLRDSKDAPAPDFRELVD